ncbi:ribosomal protection-like ABC-F family protein [Paenibacillus sp. sgz500958]|uniref:ribosomal protection-like ABC-F family protein n=1 Tax=Paenibacillus sp. sgz500958 TaxID=3242475 RepID=UPI0036D39A11
MPVIKVKDLRKEWNGVTLFEQVSFEIEEGERVLLFGRNGIGKTTLLHGLLNRLQFDEGTVYRGIPPEEWGILDQQLEIEEGTTAFDYVLSGEIELPLLKRRIEALSVEMPQAETSDEAHLAEYGEVYERYLQLDGYGWEAKAEKCLRQLKLEPEVWDLPYTSLSGGQKTRVQLAALLARQPKLLVLDEPTNHLDSGTMEWLEQWIAAYPGTVLCVSHDRIFIDRTATAVLELTGKGCRRYPGGYTQYREQKQLEARTLEIRYKKQEQEKEKLLESIRRYAEWFQQAHRAAGQNDFLRSKSKKNVSRLHAKESALRRLNENKVVLQETPKLRMRLEGGEFAADTLVTLNDVTFAYEGSRPLLENFSVSLRRGERAALIGPNGAGKSSLLKLMAGIIGPSCGTVRAHPQTKVGYFAQELDNLEADSTLLDSLLGLPGMTITEARTILGCFLFSGDDVFKRIRDLSLGEKCRIAFLRLYFGGANLLVLDEPTNYLDINTRERVEEALEAYPGALLLVSHDRYLLSRIANRLIVMKPGSPPVLFPGTYGEYSGKDRSRIRSTEELAREGEADLLKLRLSELMRHEIMESEEENRALMKEIVSLRERILKLGGSIR